MRSLSKKDGGCTALRDRCPHGGVTRTEAQLAQSARERSRGRVEALPPRLRPGPAPLCTEAARGSGGSATRLRHGAAPAAPRALRLCPRRSFLQMAAIAIKARQSRRCPQTAFSPRQRAAHFKSDAVRPLPWFIIICITAVPGGPARVPLSWALYRNTATRCSEKVKSSLKGSSPGLCRYFLAPCVNHFHRSKGHLPNPSISFPRLQGRPCNTATGRKPSLHNLLGF